MDGVYTQVQWGWNGSVLTVNKTANNTGYYKASNKFINEISIMNVSELPQAVLNRWINDTPYPDQGNVNIEYTWIPSSKELHLFDI